MNTWMKNNSGYTDSKNAYADWKDMAKISPLVSYGGVTYLNKTTSDSHESKVIMDAVKAGYYVIVGVKNGGHWVVVDNATSKSKGYPVIWDTATHCKNPASYNVGVKLFSRYDTAYSIIKYKVKNIKYTVKYNANGGKGSMANSTVIYGENNPTRANTFTRTNYAFGGWTVYRASDKKWFCKNNSTGKNGWYTTAQFNKGGYTKVVYANKYAFPYASNVNNDVITLYAVWNPVFTIKYNANGGKGTMASTKVTYSVSKPTTANSFTKSGYTFGGWYVYRKSDNKWYYRDSKGNGKWCLKGKQPKGYSLAVYKNSTTVAKTSSKAGDIVTLYAVWNKAFTVNYNANGGKGTMSPTVVTYGVNTQIRANTFTRSGYSFGGWNVHRKSDNKWYFRDSKGNGKWCYKGLQPKGYSLAVYKDSTTVAKTSSKAGDVITLCAVWNKNYTIRYNSNGGTGTMEPTVVTYGVNTKLRANTFTRAGHEFKGWSLYRTSDKKWYYQNALKKGKWCLEGEEPLGYFKAVYKDQVNVSKTSSVAGDIVILYAQWNKLENAKTFTVKYYANGGTGSMNSTTVQYGVSQKLNLNTYTRSGYSFGGWNVYRESDDKWYYLNADKTAGNWFTENEQPSGYTKSIFPDGTTVSATTDIDEDTIVLYAVWNKAVQPGSTMYISNAIVPMAKMSTGAAFTVGGVINSSYKIKSVSAAVCKTDGTIVFSAGATPNSKTYSLYNLDSKMSFGKLTAGTYKFVVTATDETGTVTLISQNFTCSATDITTASMVYPSGTLTKGKTFRVSGTVKSGKNLTAVELSVHTVDGVKKFSASANPKAKSYNVYNLDKHMLFSKLPAGKYVYRVRVADANGVSKYVITKSFTVK